MLNKIEYDIFSVFEEYNMLGLELFTVYKLQQSTEPCKW